MCAMCSVQRGVPEMGAPPPVTPPRLPVSIFVQCRDLGTGSVPAACSREVIDGQTVRDKAPLPAPLFSILLQVPLFPHTVPFYATNNGLGDLDRY